MSLAISATPPAVRPGATAQELLPETGGGGRGGPGPPGRTPAKAAGPGISGTAKASPCSGASRSVPGGFRNAASSGGSAASRAAVLASWAPSSSFRTRYIATTVRRESAIRQGAGSCPSSRYSNGGADRSARPAAIPSRYASKVCRAPAGSARAARSVRVRIR